VTVATLCDMSYTLETYVKPKGRGQRNPSLIAPGNVFGRLTAAKEFEFRTRTHDGRRRAFQRFTCECGNETWLLPYTVRSGNTSSCGCIHSESISNRMTTHGATKDRSSKTFKMYRASLTHARRAHKRNTAVEQILPDQLEEILKEYNNSCWICESPVFSIHWDHFHPLSKGGTHTLDNLRPACKNCNSKKSNYWPFTDELKQKIADEVRAQRSSQMPEGSATDGEEVTRTCQ
jgi:5-methylcytosine-specific restriction endonuclease McrA